jgi:hypothetical protein
MAANYVLLEKITVGAAGAASVTFSSIPQTGYTDLIIKTSTRNTNAVNLINYRLNFNGSSAVTINERLLYGDGSNPGYAMPTQTGGNTYGFATGASATANVFANNDYYIANYTSSNHKSVSIDMAHENDGTTAYVGIDATLWASSDAITSITLTPTTPSIGQYSTFYLYGVAKLGTTPAVAPYATGGDVVTTDGTYWYHAFKSSGTFTPKKAITCDVLTIAGGGAGGAGYSGGGGAGGLYYSSGNSVASAQTVTIGAGAAGKTSTGNGSNGSNSQFGSLTAAVGGGGGGGISGNGLEIDGVSGGSGGGAGSAVYGDGATGGTATSGQGNAGGNAQAGGRNGGGGGGAGAVGGNGVSEYTGGAGGVGSSAYSSWGAATGTGQLVSSTYYFAGGGGGWLYGAGGYGGGAAGTADSSATANTGGGGGANSGQQTGGAANGGGSGIVIVRYPI